MDLALAALLCALGGCVAGLIGVGGGIVFVPVMTIVLSKGQVEAEATSLLMIALVSLVGAWRQQRYGNVNLRDALLIGVLSPVGVVIGVVAANNLPERALRIGFAILLLYMAGRLLRHVFAPDGPGPGGPAPPAGAGAARASDPSSGPAGS
jgi:hypothetical protein